MRLCRLLDGEPDIEIPFAFWLGRLCEEFHCTPSVAYLEHLTTPVGLLEDIVEMRAFARAKARFDGATRPEDIPSSPMMSLVKEITVAVINEDRSKSGLGETSHV